MELQNGKESAKVAKLKKYFYNTIQNPELLLLLKPYGYDREKWNEGLQFIHIAENSIKEQKTMIKQARQAISESNRFLNELRTIYSIDRQLARTTFQFEPQYLHLLSLNGRIPPRSKNELLVFINRFYQLILSDTTILEKIAPLSMTKEHIHTVLHLVTKARTLIQRAEEAFSIKTQTTTRKNMDLAKLISWMAQLKLIISVAKKRAIVIEKEKVDHNLIRSIIGRVF